MIVWMGLKARQPVLHFLNIQARKLQSLYTYIYNISEVNSLGFCTWLYVINYS